MKRKRTKAEKLELYETFDWIQTPTWLEKQEELNYA
jgi:hypothetical protein